MIGTDWTPTFLEIAGVRVTEKLDGVSLAGLLTAGRPPPSRPLFWHQPHYVNQGGRPAGAVRDGDWKLVEHYESGQCELFNLSLDPCETTDLAAQQPARVAEMRGKLEQWRRDANAQENVANPKFSHKLWRQLYQDIDVSRLPSAARASELAAKLEPWRMLMNKVLPHHKDIRGVEPGPGAVILHARNATIHGRKLRYEPQAHKDTLGFWVQKDDWAAWQFETPGSGVFGVEVLQACGKGSGGSEIEVVIGDQTLRMTVAETGHFQRFVPRAIGTVTLNPGRHTLAVRVKAKPGPAVMDLRRVVLRGSCGD